MNTLFPLLAYLDADAHSIEHAWRGWTITPVGGGANNLLYRVQSGETGDAYAVKFTVRDARNRAGREFAALRALQAAGLSIAPRALWWSADRYRQPVVIQRWLDGEVLTGPPDTSAGWDALLAHYCAIHTITPTTIAVALNEAVLNAAHGTAGKALVAQNVARLPHSTLEPALQSLLAWFDGWDPPQWPAAPRALCRVDANWRNFIRRGGTSWASVDWENSGWGDPAFEVADLMTHPAYWEVGPETWQPLVDAYAAQMHDATARLRIETYYTIMLVWWCTRFARYLYEMPRGLDARLVEQPPDWQATAQRKYAQYLARAEAHIVQL